MRILPTLVVAIGLLFSSSAAAAEPMAAPAPPPAPRIQLPRGGVLIRYYAPRTNDTQRVIVVDAAKENALVRYLDERLVLAHDALATGNFAQALDHVTSALHRFEQVVGSAVDRFGNARTFLEAHAYLVLTLREPEEARRLCTANLPRRMPTLAWMTCEALVKRRADDD